MRLETGGLVDRARPLAFRFDGVAYEGLAGDSLAAALLANGVRLVGRSFKYHRPRGVFGAGIEEPNALVELREGARREPNTRATTVELHDGLTATSQNRWPSLRLDVMAVNQLMGPIYKAGFYYKTFMWPASFWERVYEPLIRRAAGMGRAPDGADPDRYARGHRHCDVLVIGGGPAGLMAALLAARAGARVVLADDDWRLGGRLLAEREEIDGAPALDWVARVETELATLPEVTILRRTTVVATYDHGVFAAVERVGDHLPVPAGVRQRAWTITARGAVLAAGALERPIVFGDNDRPGVMSAAAVRAYVNRWAVLPGRQAVVFTAGDDGWRTARDLAAAGATVAAVVDARADAPAALRAGLPRDVAVYAGGRVVGVRGRGAVTGVEVREGGGKTLRLACDLVAVAGGWTPTLHLAGHLGGKPRWDAAAGLFVPDALPPGMWVAGAATGRLTLAGALASGAEAAAAALQALGRSVPARDLPRAGDEPADCPPLWHVAESRGTAFVDLQNDVTAADVALAAREGYRSVEHLKRYTTLGMGPDQGRTANVPALALLAAETGRGIAETGTTVFRPPYGGVAIGALAGPHRGRHFRPARLTPTHDWAKARGAVFVEAGAWSRAQWYPEPGETEWRQSVDREVRAVRERVGVCDVSTLGKIEVVGPGAAALLDFAYANTISTLAVGRVRYGLMLREDGFALDDGTVARLAEDRFFVTTTTVNAAKVLQHLEFCHEVLRPELDVTLLSVTDRWAQLSIAGPRAREVVAAVVDPPTDVSGEAMPHMSVRAVSVDGMPGRLFRLSFSGELAYELAVPADRGEELMRRVTAAGAAHRIAPYGTEALGVLRIEKGHVGGGELNGQTTAQDLALGGMLSRNKDFVGRALAQRPALTDPGRPRLVGLVPVDRTAKLAAGAHLLPRGAAAVSDNDQGYVTSAAHSPTLGHAVALALLSRGGERMGERVRAYDPVRGGDVEVEVVHRVFVDPEGRRVHA